MAPPLEPSDSSPFTKHKKKKKKSEKRDEERRRGDEETSRGDEETSQGDEETSQGDEETSQGDEETSQGSKDVKKKRKKRMSAAQTEVEETSGEGNGERKQGDEGRDQGDEEMRKKKKRRRENGTQPEETTQGNKTRRKEGRKRNKETPRRNRARPKESEVDDMNDTEQEIQVSSSDVLELEEFIPDISRKSPEVKQKMIRYDLPRFREFKKKGLKLRWGKYSVEENLQIRRNVENFMKLTQIQTTEQLFYPQRFPEQEQNLRELKSRHQFYIRIADGLLRTCEQVYNRSKKLYDPRNHLGRFSEEEVETLQKLQAIHGNDWKTIGNKLERSFYACEKRHAQTGGNRGPWTPEELHRLKKATKKHLKRVLKSSTSPAPDPGPDPSPGPDLGPSFIQLCSKMPWRKISQKVQTRSWLQCRIKWFLYLKSRLKASGPKLIQETSKHTRVRLIQTLYELQVEDVSDVDWIQVAKSVGGVTPICVQRLFHRMKVSRIPNSTQLSFGDMVDYLFENELPLLLKKLKSPPSPGPGPGPTRFSLDYLFPPDQEEDYTEVDNS